MLGRSTTFDNYSTELGTEVHYIPYGHHHHFPVYFQRIACPQDRARSKSASEGLCTDGDQNRLLLSIQQYGIQQPLAVSEIQDNRYLILDGHRRYICAQKLGLTPVPCRIYPKLPVGHFESLRYEIQNNRRPWRPLEKAEALRSLKDLFRFENNQKLAEHIHMGESSIRSAMHLAKEKSIFLELMASYDLAESYQVEFVRLKPKLRKLRDLEVDNMIKALFMKVQAKAIRNSRDLEQSARFFYAPVSTNETFTPFSRTLT
jgi:ParB/RepB/Spo0J family partition protein